ncbi:MAG: hypothetical protein ANABAC_2871 [Anaerolineae bacterium]|nr:MAG: hypothetical protein ANABAC_2871 [Anaerolineae bacterium]
MHKTLTWLVPLIAVLAFVSALAGLFLPGGTGPFTFTSLRGYEVQMFGRGLYQYDTLLVGAALRGTDAVTLLISLPLLMYFFWKAQRGGQNARLALLGVQFYFLYKGASLTFSAAFNALFLVYTALFSTSLFAVIITMTTFDLASLAKRVQPGFPHRSVAIFLLIAGLGTLLIWLSEVIPPILEGGAPQILGTYTTLFTHGFDSAVISPAAVIAGVCLLRRNPLGYLLAAPLLILCALIGAVVIGQTIAQTWVGLVFPPQVYIGLIGAWIVMGAFAIGLTVSFFRLLEDTQGYIIEPKS